jgi:urease accessory protein
MGETDMSTDTSTETDADTDTELHAGGVPLSDVVPVTGVALTRLLQLVSPALPTGAFAYSQGLEQAVASGWVTDEASAREWVIGLLEHGIATLDLPVLERLIDAWRSDDRKRVDEWTAWLTACRPTREARAEERQIGAALARTLAAIGVADAAGWEARPDVTQAAMFALAAVRYAIPTAAALAGYAFAWAEASTSAAVRLVPLGQSAGQRLLAAAGDDIPAAVDRARLLDDEEIGTTAPGQAIASALHEALYSRLFRS